MNFDYDLFTIGAGSGGTRASRIAAGFGAKVAVAEEFRVGGTCVIRGCVPKKLMVYAGRFGADLEEARNFGWDIESYAHDWARLIANKDREIARLEGLYRKGLNGAGAEIIDERAQITGPHDIRLMKSGRTVTAKHILIATGAAPHKPEGVPGIEHAITSNEIFHLRQRPERIVIVGAGYIALEFASLLNGLGSEVTIVHYAPEILRGFDRELRHHLHRELAKSGIKFEMDTNLVGLRRDGAVLEAGLSTGKLIECDQLMLATGRWPNTLGLGLENAGVALDDKGAVIVDSHSRSSVPNIYAVGDVTNRVNLTPVAIREGHYFAETVFNNNPLAVDHTTIPTAVFTTPEVGTVGLTEEAARRSVGAVHIYKSQFRPMKYTLGTKETQMLFKLVVDAHTDRVLGCHIVGPDAAEIIQAVGIAVKMGATKRDFDATIALHPSAAEELVLMRQPVT